MTIFSLGCPKCNYIIALARSKCMNVCIISDEKQVLEQADKYHLNEIPFAVIDDKVYNSEELEKYMEEI